MQRNPTSLRRKAKRTYFVERVRERDHILDRTKREDMVVYQDDNMLSLVLIVLDMDFTVLWLHLCSVFSIFMPGS